MSTVAYSLITAQRKQSPPSTSTTTNAPGIGAYIDTLAALVPAEVLAVHAVVISATTSDTGVRQGAFWALTAVAAFLYVIANVTTWDHWDYLRVLIPAAAFVGWTMLQKDTVFDQVAPSWSTALRTTVAVIGAVVLAPVAVKLAYKADATPAPPVVTGVLPDQAPRAGGTVVTITGSGLGNATQVHFGPNVVQPPFTYSSDTKLQVASPPSAAPDTVHVTVDNPSGTSSTSDADQFTNI